jgi:hypothetical protein
MLSVGAATVVITPPVGLDLEGYLRDAPATEVLDELSCQAVVFDDGTTRLVRDPECVMLTATHTHCGPAHLASPDHEDLISRLSDGVVEAITAASEAARPARLHAGTVPVHGIAGNRRNPAGPVEENATFLAAFPLADGVSEAIATIVNFACHPGPARRTIEQLCGGTARYAPSGQPPKPGGPAPFSAPPYPWKCSRQRVSTPART